MKLLLLILVLLSQVASAACKQVYSVAWLHPFRSIGAIPRLLTKGPAGIEKGQIDTVYRISENTLQVTDAAGRNYLIESGKAHDGAPTVTITSQYGAKRTIPKETWDQISDGRLPKEQTVRGYYPIDQFRRAERTRDQDIQAITDSLKFAPKLLFYPYAIPYKVVRHWITERTFMGKRIGAAIAHTLKRDGVLIAGYLLLVYTGTHPSLVFVASEIDDAIDEIMDKQGTIDLGSFIEVTNTRVNRYGDGISVFVDGVPSNNILEGGPRFLFDQTKRERSHYLKASSVAELDKVAGIAKAAGKTIDHMDVFGHGDSLPGVNLINIGNDFLTSEPEKVKRLLSETVAKAYATAEREGKEVPREIKELEKMNVVSMDDFPNLKAHFSKGATVRLISCLATAGKGGDALMEGLGDKTVAGKGGAVLGATKSIGLDFDDFPLERREAVLMAYLARKEEIRREEIERAKAEKTDALDHIAGHATLHAVLPYLFVRYGESYFDGETFKPEAALKQMTVPAR